MLKYVLSSTPETGTGLYRIKALVDIPSIGVTAGDLGGLVSSDSSLSQHGSSWIDSNARVHGDAYVYGNAHISGNAHVYGDARIYGNAQMYDNAFAYNNARVSNNARILGDACVSGNAQIHDDICVSKCHTASSERHHITAVNTHVFIGCEGHTWNHWFTYLDVIGCNNNYTDSEIAAVRAALQYLHYQVHGVFPD